MCSAVGRKNRKQENRKQDNLSCIFAVQVSAQQQTSLYSDRERPPAGRRRVCDVSLPAGSTPAAASKIKGNVGTLRTTVYVSTVYHSTFAEQISIGSQYVGRYLWISASICRARCSSIIVLVLRPLYSTLCQLN